MQHFYSCVCGMCGLTFTAILNVPSKTLDWLLGWILGTKLFSLELQCYFLYVHKQIRSKVPILLYFVGPKHPSGNCCVSCFLTDETALRLGVKLDPNPNPGWKFVQVEIVKRLIWTESIFDTAQISLFIRELLSHRQEEKRTRNSAP